MKTTIALFSAALALAGCRSIDASREESELAAAPDRAYFDAYGDQVDCDAPAPKEGCPVGSFDPGYIDACVTKGFQGKSCGCIAACSGKVVTKQKTAEVAALSGSSPDVCSEADRRTIADSFAGRTAETSKCIEAHLCKGDDGPCTERAKPVSMKLRQLARGACSAEVFGRFCGGASIKGVLECSDADIATLSETYQEAFGGGDDPRLRRCLREKLCNIMTGDCKDQVAAKAEKAVASIRSKGCDYWVATFCSLK